MNLKKAVYEISFEDSEVWDLASCIQSGLKRSIQDHYNCLQQDQDGEQLFFEQEKRKLYILQNFYGLLGVNSMYKSYENDYKRMFENKRKERQEVIFKDLNKEI